MVVYNIYIYIIYTPELRIGDCRFPSKKAALEGAPRSIKGAGGARRMSGGVCREELVLAPLTR